MKTNIVLKKTLLAGSAVILLTASAQAAFNPPRGNLLFGAREINSGVNGTDDIIVDLGSFTRFTSGTTAYFLGGSSGSESYMGLTPLTANENRFAGSAVTTLFGNLDNVRFSAFGVDSVNGDGGAGLNTLLFLTRGRGAGTPNTQTTPWTGSDETTMGTVGNATENIRGNGINFGVDYSNTATKETAANANSLTSQSGTINASYQIENDTGTGFTGSAIRRSDLYYVPGEGAAGDYLGYFEYQADGDLWFIPENFVPVPEASTYGLIAGAGLLLVALRRQLSTKSA